MVAVKKIKFEAPFKRHHKSLKVARKIADVKEDLKHRNPKSCLHR